MLRIHRLKFLSLFGLLLWLPWTMGFAPGFPGTNRRQSPTIMQQLSSSEKEASSFDMKELRERINDLYGCQIPVKGAFGVIPTRDRPKPDKVHVVVFQPGTINQGAHTIEYPKGSGINVVLAFESIESCRQFAASLVEQKFVDPTVGRITLVCARRPGTRTNRGFNLSCLSFFVFSHVNIGCRICWVFSRPLVCLSKWSPMEWYWNRRHKMSPNLDTILPCTKPSKT